MWHGAITAIGRGAGFRHEQGVAITLTKAMQPWARSQSVMQPMCAIIWGVGIETVDCLDMDETQNYRPRRGLSMHMS